MIITKAIIETMNIILNSFQTKKVIIHHDIEKLTRASRTIINKAFQCLVVDKLIKEYSEGALKAKYYYIPDSDLILAKEYCSRDKINKNKFHPFRKRISNISNIQKYMIRQKNLSLNKSFMKVG